ncbi:putative RNA-directed DNA polymerase [Tanacetum coccineum]
MSLHGYSDGEYDNSSDVANVTLINKLDVSHPLHLHPNDFVALTVVSVKLKRTENYQVLSCAMLLALEGWILNSVFEELFLGQIFSKRAKHVCDELKETYDKVDGSVTFSLHHKIHTLSQNGSSNIDYYHKLNALWKQFDSLIELPRSSILSKETLPDVRSAYAIISSEESHRIASGSVSGTSQRPNDNENRRTARGSTLVCENCGLNGHTIDKRFKIIGYPTDFRKRKHDSNLKGKNVSNNVVGANQHITYTDKNLINVIDISYLKIKVTHPNGTEAFITRIGNIPLIDYLTLYDVLAVPEYCVSLMSVHKVVRDSKLVIAFDEMHCYVMNQDLRKGKILGIGKKIGGLYYFDGNQGIPLNMWTEYVLTATYLINRLPTSVLNGKSPYDLVYNKPPSLKHLRSFDCLAYATILNSHDKFGSRSEKCVLVGNSNSKKRYKLWSLDNKEVIYSRDVKFFEDMFPFKKNISTGIDKSLKDVNHLNFLNFNTLDDLPEIPNDEERRNPSPIRHGNSPSHYNTKNESFAADEDKNSSSEGNGLHDQSQDNVSQDNNGVQNLRRSSRTFVFPKKFNDFIVESKVKHGLEKYVNYSYLSKGNYCFAIMLNKGVEPKTYLKVSQHKHRVDLMNVEMDALYKNNTWEIVDLSVRRKAIGSKWVWKIKYKSDGEIERYKARLVAKEEIIYMTLPPGYFSDNETKVCKLNKSMYGLKQAPRQWNAKLTVALHENNFVQSKSDYSLFTKSFGEVFIALLVYVDDIIITENSLTKIEKVKQFLKTKFMIKDLGKLKYFLGIEPNISLTSEPSDTDPLLDNVTGYQKLIGKLIYLTTTRPDIAYTVSCLSQFMHNPLKSHLKTALKVIRYLKGSPGKGINVIKGSASIIDLKAYSDADWEREGRGGQKFKKDADWAGCPTTRRSTSGYCVFLGNNLLSWSSKRQPTLSRSSAEAEYRGVANAVAETCWLRNLLRELHTPLSSATLVYYDNVSAVYLSCNPVQHQRTKHIEIDIHFVRDLVTSGQVRVLHVPSRYQFADIFTKGLPSSLFEEFRSSLSVRRSLAPTAGEC